MMFRVFLPIFVCCAVLISGCGEKPSNENTATNDTAVATEESIRSSIETIGVDGTYIALSRPAFDTSDDRVTITEVFRYTSPASYAAQAFMNEFRYQFREQSIDYQYIPMGGSDIDNLHALGFFASQKIGRQHDSHLATFYQLHRFNNRLADTPTLLNYYAGSLSVNYYEFEKILNDPLTKQHMENAQALLDTLSMTTVPTFIINGQFIVDAKLAGDVAAMFVIIKQLSERELAKL